MQVFARAYSLKILMFKLHAGRPPLAPHGNRRPSAGDCSSEGHGSSSAEKPGFDFRVLFCPAKAWQSTRRVHEAKLSQRPCCLFLPAFLLSKKTCRSSAASASKQKCSR